MENDETYALQREIFRIAALISKAHNGQYTITELADIIRKTDEDLTGLCVGISESAINAVTADGKQVFFKTISDDFLKSVTNAKEGDVIVFIKQ